MKPSTKLHHWQVTQRALDTERERRAFLKSPLPKNDPAVMAPTKVKVLRAAFCIGGKPVIEGDVLSIPRCDALGLQVTGKIEILE